MNSLAQVLLIASRPQTLSAIQGVLPCHLTVAWTVQSAIDASDSSAFELVIIDSRLPQIEPHHLVDRLRSLPGHSDLPALVLTKSGVDEMVKIALASFLADNAAKDAAVPNGHFGTAKTATRLDTIQPA